jgi:diaminopimelate decarboxylase
MKLNGLEEMPALTPRFREVALSAYQELGRPFYVFDFQILASRWKAFLDAAPERARVYYAAMANDDPSVLSWFKARGQPVFVGSWDHLAHVERLGFKRDNISAGLTNLGRDQVAIVLARAKNVILGSQRELEHARSIRSENNILLRASIAEPTLSSLDVRCMGVEPRTVSEQWSRWQRKDARLVGLHSYAGTNLKTFKLLAGRAARAIRFASNLSGVKIIDIGGGFPAMGVGMSVQDMLHDFWKTITPKLGKMELWVEPGRFPLTPASCFVTRVTSVEERFRRIYVGTDAPVLMFPRRVLFRAPDSDHPVMVVHSRQRARSSRWSRACIVGNTTYSRDVLYNGPLSKVVVGDLLVFANAGAYCRTAVPRFLGTGLPPQWEIEQTSASTIRPILKQPAIQSVHSPVPIFEAVAQT